MRVAFDVDDTLIIPSVAQGIPTARDIPNYDTVAVYKWFQAQGNFMIVWSGSGIDWARTWSEKLGLNPDAIIVKGGEPVDIAFDDCDVTLGTVNVKVKRTNNGISRDVWNATKSNAAPKELQ